MEQEILVKKIQKLFALADKSSNNSPEEAEAALLKAQQLMAQYNIAMEQVASQEESVEYSMEFCQHKGDKGFRAQLATIIARNFRCKPFIAAGQVAFFGHKHDAQAAKAAFEYAYKFAKKRGDAMVASARKNQQITKGVFNSYVLGFLRGLELKLDEQCRALAIVVPTDVLTERKQRYDSRAYTGGMRSSCFYDQDSYSTGLSDGKSFLSRQQIES